MYRIDAASPQVCIEAIPMLLVQFFEPAWAESFLLADILSTCCHSAVINTNPKRSRFFVWSILIPVFHGIRGGAEGSLKRTGTAKLWCSQTWYSPQVRIPHGPVLRDLAPGAAEHALLEHERVPESARALAVTIPVA